LKQRELPGQPSYAHHTVKVGKIICHTIKSKGHKILMNGGYNNGTFTRSIAEELNSQLLFVIQMVGQLRDYIK
jgi:hypothetical protein